MLRQKLFQVFGGEELGLKAQDLLNHQEMIEQVGCFVPVGFVVAVEVFDRFIDGRGYTEDALAGDILSEEIPEEVEKINQQLLTFMPIGVPFAVRSTARSERGGTGIYRTFFFVPTEDKQRDERALWFCEREVYASEFTLEAKEWRKRQNDKIGMAILIQPVVGQQFGDYFCPLLSGSAYTSYRGEPLVRVAVGLGAMAVASAEIPAFKESPPQEYSLALIRHQERITAINLKESKAVNIPKEWVGIELSSTQPIRQLFGKMEAMAESERDFFLEWAVAGDDSEIAIVQCALYEDKAAIPIDVKTEGKVLVAQGTDIVNHGRKICKHIVYAGYRAWDAKALGVLSRLNGQLKDFLLIVPQEGFSILASSLPALRGSQSLGITYEHFSNAGTVLEKQKSFNYDLDTKIALYSLGIPVTDHTKDRGGMHFQQLCDRSDILFLGTEFDDSIILELEGASDYGGNVKVWDVEVEVVNDMTKGEGYVYLTSKPRVVEYTIPQLEDWTMALRETANRLEGDLANHFYIVHYATVPWIRNPNGFDPFMIDPAEIKSLGGVEAILESLGVVLEKGEHYVDAYLWREMQPYLEQLQERLARREV